MYKCWWLWWLNFDCDDKWKDRQTLVILELLWQLKKKNCKVSWWNYFVRFWFPCVYRIATALTMNQCRLVPKDRGQTWWCQRYSRGGRVSWAPWWTGWGCPPWTRSCQQLALEECWHRCLWHTEVDHSLARPKIIYFTKIWRHSAETVFFHFGGNLPFHVSQGKCTRNLWFRLHLYLLSYCQTKYDNENKDTKHLLKLFGSDM